MKRILIPFVMLAVLMAMTFTSVGCSTSKTIVERDTVTIYQKQGDSVNIINKVNIKDSVRISDSTVVTVNDKGEVIKHESWHNREHISSVSDSTQYYKAQYDSLYASYTRLREEKSKTTNNALTGKEKLKSTAKGVFYGTFLGFIIALLIWYGLHKKKTQPP